VIALIPTHLFWRDPRGLTARARPRKSALENILWCHRWWKIT